MVLMNIDVRELMGINVWLKPAKFWFSSSLFIISIPYYIKEAHASKQQTYARVFLAAIWVQNLLISFQAIRGEQSHFNTSDPWSIAILSLLSIAIFVNTLYLLFLLLDIRKTKPDMDDTKKRGISAALILALLACLGGGAMSAMQKHSIGVDDGGPGLPFLNWSTVAGDLRVMHFMGLHAILFFPLLLAFLPLPYRKQGVQWAVYLYSASFILMSLQALLGFPLLTFQTN